MKLIGNLIWFVFGGFLASLVWFLAGLIAVITVIGIPFSGPFFKLSRLMLFPFGKDIYSDFGKHPILNILWAIFVGWELAIAYLAFAVLSFITVIGIPFSIQWAKLTILALFPFGAKVK